MSIIMKSEFYQVEKQEYIEEIACDVTVLTHTSSGARVLVLANDDENKAFCAGFKTIPEDDTGVAHIMEHSVLCGSRKYPLREPFVELMKGSLNTFLNAMTYPDKTVYPVASCNEEDFHNLMDVYLDSVFFPKLEKEAFLQEGWHYQVAGDGSLSYKGVVYNEMKGVYSSPESVLMQEVDRLLYIDTAYANDSGGYPDAIPGLTYEAYLDFHDKNYHPSNSCLVLYGAIDIERCLDQLHEGYLKNFEKREIEVACLEQKLFDKEVHGQISYAAAPGEQEGRSFLALSYLMCSNTEPREIAALQVLDHILIGTAASPLRKEMLSSGLGGDVMAYGLSDQSLQCSWSFGLRDTDADKKQAFLELFDKVLTDLVHDGISDKLVEAALNSVEFRLREADFGSYPKGVVYALNAISAWNYDCDPLERLKYEEVLQVIKDEVSKGGYFEGLIKKYFLDNKHRVVVACVPDEHLSELHAAEQKAKLEEKKQGFEVSEIEALREQEKALLVRQTTPDTPEALASIPALSRKDLKKTVEEIPTIEKQVGGIKFLIHPQAACNGVVYLKFVFDVSDLALDELPLARLFTTLCLNVGAGDLSFDELTTELACVSGGVSASFGLPKNLDGKLRRHFNVSAKVMVDKLPELMELMADFTKGLDFSDEKRVRELLSQAKSRIEASFVRSGEWFSRLMLNAGLDENSYCGELISGPSYLSFIEAQLVALDAGGFSAFQKSMQSLKERLFNKEALLVNLTARQEDVQVAETSCLAWIKDLASREVNYLPLEIKLKPENMGFATQGKVQYVSTGVNLKALGLADDSRYILLNQLLSTGFLWERVRVQGGAYGCFLSYNQFDGILNITSYRDPNLRETLDIYKELADHLRKLELSEEEFEKIVIGTFGRIDAPLSPSDKGGVALTRYLSGVNTERMQRRRDELLTATLADIRALADWFEALNENALICVHGSAEKVNEAAGLFDRIEVLAGAGGDDDDDEDDDDEDDFCK